MRSEARDATIVAHPTELTQIGVFWIDPTTAGFGIAGAASAPVQPACGAAPTRATVAVSGPPGVGVCLDASGPAPKVTVVNTTAVPLSGALPAGSTATLGAVDARWTTVSSQINATTDSGRLLLAPGASATMTTADAEHPAELTLSPDLTAMIVGAVWNASLRWSALFAQSGPHGVFDGVMASEPAARLVRSVSECVARSGDDVTAVITTCTPVAVEASGQLDVSDIRAGVALPVFLDSLGLATLISHAAGAVATVAPRKVVYTPAPPLTSPTWDELKNASIPSMCQHPPAKLIDGVDRSLPPYDGVHEYIGELRLLRTLSDGQPGLVTDIPSEAGPLTAVVVSCNAGGVAWPNAIMFFSSGGVYYGHNDLFADGPDATAPWKAAGLNEPGREGVMSLERIGDELEVLTSAETGTDAACCPSTNALVRLRPDHGRIRITSIKEDLGD